MLSWLSGKRRQDPGEEAHQVRCRMGAHERSAIVAEGAELYSTCTHCGRRLVRVGGDWRVALDGGGHDRSASRQSGAARIRLPH